MKVLLVSSQDYIHHPIPSRHHYIFEELSKRHEIDVAHFHVSQSSNTRQTSLKVQECTLINVQDPFLHYTLNSPYHFIRFDELMLENDYDVVVCAHVLAATAAIRSAKKYGVPVLFDLKDWFPDSAAAYIKNPYLKRIVNDSVLEITKYNLRLSNKISTVSPSLSRQLKSFGFDSTIITNGVGNNFKEVYPGIVYDEFNFKSTDFIIGFAGSVERWYALDEIIKLMPIILKRIPTAILFIVGDSLFTGYKSELLELSENVGVKDKVIFAGTRPYNSLPEYINAMDVCLIPLSPPQWRNIALPNKYFEYSACNKPILMTHIPDVQDLKPDNIFVYNNDIEFVNLLESIYMNKPKFTIDMTQFHWSEKAKQMENLLVSLI